MIHLGKVVQIANRLGCLKRGIQHKSNNKTVLFAKALVQWDVNKLPLAKPPERVSSH